MKMLFKNMCNIHISPFKILHNLDDKIQKICSEINGYDTKLFLEGQRLLIDAIKVNIMPELLIYESSFDFTKFCHTVESYIYSDIQCYSIYKKTMKKISRVKTPPGICGIFSYNSYISRTKNSQYLIPLNIICDNIRDPGNLGTLIRTMGALGAENVYLLKGCTNAWESKVIRAAAGGHFRVPIYHHISIIDIEKFLPKTTKILVAQNFESNLNQNFQSNPLQEIPSIPYTKLTSYLNPLIDYNNSCPTTVALILGNESRGLSSDVKEWLASRMEINLSEGTYPYNLPIRSVNIPMGKNTESLNVTIAAAIISYEIKRIFDS